MWTLSLTGQTEGVCEEGAEGGAGGGLGGYKMQIKGSVNDVFRGEV